MSNKICDLSIVLPGIRQRNWKSLYDSVSTSIGDYSFEMIIVGPGSKPLDLEGIDNFHFIEDYGAPARSAQIGVAQASGKYMTWASDDGVFLPNALKEAIDLLSTKNRNDVIIMRYSEGGNSQGEEYWTAWTHADLRLNGVPQHYKCAPVGLYHLDYFKEIGGWDCRYEHLNMCCHDLAFRVQNDGGELFLAPLEILQCTWDVHSEEWAPIGRAYHENDLPLWNSMYTQDQSQRIKIDYNNWKTSPARWTKRFGTLNE